MLTFAITQVKVQKNKLLGTSRNSSKVRFYRNNIVHINSYNLVLFAYPLAAAGDTQLQYLEKFSLW